MRGQFVRSVGLGAVLAATLWGHATVGAYQDPVQDPPPPPFVVPNPGVVNLSKISTDYKVGPGDLLEIQIVQRSDLNQTLRVSNSGEISFTMLGLIRVGEMSAFDIEDLIATRLREAGFIQQADVLVYVREYQAKPIYVSGAVINPGEFIMSQELTVVDAILLAGGLRANAANEALLHRRVSREDPGEPALVVGADPRVAGPGVEIIKVDLQPLRKGRFMDAALPLRRGDVLVVPEVRLNAFYVVGEVLEPTNYIFQPGQVLMASQAISMAGGPTPTAKMSDGMLVRYDDSGKRTELKVDYGAILRGKQQDFPIQANDVIFIPGSKVKYITHTLLLMTDQLAMQQIFRAGRRMNQSDYTDRDQ